jgi:hypothetical protein
LTHGASGNIEEALRVYARTLAALQDGATQARETDDALEERLHQNKARLLYYHATTSHHFRPALLRDEFAASIRLFKHNTIFLGLFAWIEARFRVDDRVRSILRDTVLTEGDESVVGWVFAVWNEVRGTLGRGHNINSAKAVFERAVASARYGSAFLFLSSLQTNSISGRKFVGLLVPYALAFYFSFSFSLSICSLSVFLILKNLPKLLFPRKSAFS